MKHCLAERLLDRRPSYTLTVSTAGHAETLNTKLYEASLDSFVDREHWASACTVGRCRQLTSLERTESSPFTSSDDSKVPPNSRQELAMLLPFTASCARAAWSSEFPR